MCDSNVMQICCDVKQILCLDPSTYITADVRFVSEIGDAVLTNEELQTIISLDVANYSEELIRVL